jgi:arabinogalactan endo-1,4-beta-galactosidase
VFREGGVARPGLANLREHGYSWVRLRLFHSLRQLPNNLDYTVQSARAATRLGYRFLLDLHDSDTWSDPAKHFILQAWEDYGS